MKIAKEMVKREQLAATGTTKISLKRKDNSITTPMQYDKGNLEPIISEEQWNNYNRIVKDKINCAAVIYDDEIQKHSNSLSSMICMVRINL